MNTPTTTIYRTGIHTFSTTDTIQCLHMIRLGQNLTSSVIHNDDMEFTTLRRLSVMRGIRCDWLPCTGTGQQTRENAQSFPVGNNLFHTKSSNMNLGKRSSHIGVPFIRTNHYLPCRSNCKISSCH